MGDAASPLPLFLALANLLDVDAALCRGPTVCIKGCGRVNRTDVQALPTLYDDKALDIRPWELAQLPPDIHAVYG